MVFSDKKIGEPAEGSEIGKRVIIREDVMIYSGAVIRKGTKIGKGSTVCDGVAIHKDAIICEKVEICKNAIISEGVIIHKEAIICEDAIICENVTIHEGADIGEGAIINEGASIRKDSVIRKDAEIGKGRLNVYNAKCFPGFGSWGKITAYRCDDGIIISIACMNGCKGASIDETRKIVAKKYNKDHEYFKILDKIENLYN